MKVLVPAIVSGLVATALLAGLPPAVVAQVPPGGMPSPQEIERRLTEEFDKLPDQTSEVEGLKLTYKAIPSDPQDAVKNSGQVPPGMDVDSLAKQYAPMARPYIEKYCGKVGKLKVEKEFKFKSAKVPPGDYVFGLVMDEMTPVAVAISGGALKAPLRVPLRAGKPPAEPFAELKLEVKPGKTPGKEKEEFTFAVSFGKLDGEAGKFAFKK